MGGLVRDLDTIRVLFRQPDSLSLWGIPYRMRKDCGQTPAHLIRSDCTEGWIWLGQPGWFGSMTSEKRVEVEDYIHQMSDLIPQNPGEWTDIRTYKAGVPYLSNLGELVFRAWVEHGEEDGPYGGYDRFNREWDLNLPIEVRP